MPVTLVTLLWPLKIAVSLSRLQRLHSCGVPLNKLLDAIVLGLGFRNGRVSLHYPGIARLQRRPAVGKGRFQLVGVEPG